MSNKDTDDQPFVAATLESLSVQELRAGVALQLRVIERLRAENEALRADAERYRWLREGCNDKCSTATRIALQYYGMEWDAAIDAAMKETK